MKKITILFFIAISLLSCQKEYKHIQTSCQKEYKYPESKLWKHGVYSKWEAKELEGVFDGLEVDVIYSPEKNNIYVGRVVADTIKNLPLDEWFSVLNEPSKTYYWIDFKNLSKENADSAFEVLNPLVKKYGIEEVTFVESQDLEALKIAKENDYRTILWVENLHYWKKRYLKDTIFVMNKIRSQIEELHPDAISCEYTMFPLLCDTFPEQNIHFWDTPKDYTPENVEFTKKLCENESVKVVLVDYPTADIF